MRQKIFHSVFFIVLCFAFFSGNAMAQSIIVNNQCAKNSKSKLLKPDIDLSKYDKRVLGNGMEMYNEKKNQYGSKKLGADDYATVTFKYQFNLADFWPNGCVIVYGDNIDRTVFWGDVDYGNGIFGDIVCQLPKGKCDVLAQALPRKDGIEIGSITYKIFEQLTINQDTTIIVNFDDCTNQYYLKTFKPNGEEVKRDVYIRNENYEVEDTIKGNINSMADHFSIILKGTGAIMNYMVFADYEWYGQNPSRVFMNNVSDRYKIGALRMFNDNSDADLYVVKHENQSMTEHILQNDAKDYVFYQEKFTPSLSHNLNGDGVMNYVAKAVIDNVNINALTFGPVLVSECKAKVYIDAAQSESNEKGKCDVLVNPVFGDKIKTKIYTYSWENEDGEIFTESDTVYEINNITGLPVMINSNKGIEYINTGYDFGNVFNVPEGGGDIMVYPGHPRFSYYKSQKILDYGSNAPINVLKADNTEGDWFEGKFTTLRCGYFGRYGEMRDVDLDTLQIEIRYNDELICNNYSTIFMDLYHFAGQGNPDGEITAHFVNNNVMVDGLQGMNVTDMYINQRQEDWTAPMLHMLLFKDLEGNIIDRFDSAEEGVLEFAGGDFYPITDAATYVTWYDCKPMTVEVSYSPYSAEDWAPLEVNEIPEEYYMPGFGFFYRGSLKDVTGRGEKGWFDLKIKLTDLSGNWQEQVISPAFRIGSGNPSKIEVVESDTATEVARYTIDGRALSAPQAGVNIVKMSDGTVKKVLVK